MKASAERLIEVFNEAKARSGADREQYLAQACQDDPGLKAQVISLLQASEVAGDFLKNSHIPAVTEQPGDRIGPYKLLQKLGEGGFGVVYVAEQEAPLRRRVALKVIKVGMDTRQIVARFEAERQALARMDHPNIARVLEAGATATGRPYFVMELVDGICITAYCDQQRLSTQERLKLFSAVCNAVQHAHQKGIVHRDLKPSNILVTIVDGKPAPKIIDFGIAKATEEALGEKTLVTELHQFMGTPAYTSPEQAGLGNVAVDSRTDIYSLGVVLYELLTGYTPFDFRRWMHRALDEVRRTIREVDPVRPSTKLSTLAADDLTTVAARRSVDPSKLVSAVSGDLDLIALKCLEKDRTHRYATANALALDIQRYLQSEPVLARPPNNVYRLWKGMRRNKVALGAAAAVAAALLIGIAASSFVRQSQRRAQPTHQTVSGVPNRSPETPPNLIDLSRFYNIYLEGGSGWQLSETTEHATRRFGDVFFDVRGAVRLASPSPLYAGLPYPPRVEGIPVSQSFRRLHFLHFVFNSERAGVTVATYRLRYINGTALEVLVKYGNDVRTWAASGAGSADPRYTLENTNSAVAWTGTNVAGNPVRLFSTSWDNPIPEVQIKAIDFISNMTDCSPVLVAITAEP